MVRGWVRREVIFKRLHYMRSQHQLKSHNQLHLDCLAASAVTNQTPVLTAVWPMRERNSRPGPSWWESKAAMDCSLTQGQGGIILMIRSCTAWGNMKYPLKIPKNYSTLYLTTPPNHLLNPLIAIILLSVHYRAIISTFMKRKGHKICTHGLLPSWFGPCHDKLVVVHHDGGGSSSSSGYYTVTASME